MWIGYGFLILCFCQLASGFYTYECRNKHERFSTCGDDCGKSCRDRDTPKVCEKKCRVGCFCESGYIRNSNNDCVKPTECGGRHELSSSSEEDKKCGPNEEYTRCRSKCEPTCNSRKRDKCDKPCEKRGCLCKSGFVRDNHGDCIPREFCPKRKICGKNEKWTNATVPPGTCQTPHCFGKLPKYCPLYFTVGGCICKDGLKRNNAGECVLPTDCPKSWKKGGGDKDKKKKKKSRKNRKRGDGDRDCDKSSGRKCDDYSDEYDSDERSHSFDHFFGHGPGGRHGFEDIFFDRDSDSYDVDERW